MSNRWLWDLGIVLILGGFAVSFIAVILLMLSSAKDVKRRVKGGGVIIIGPIPIVFGTDKESAKTILVLSIVLVALLLVLSFFFSNIFG